MELVHDYRELKAGSSEDRIASLVVAEWEKKRSANSPETNESANDGIDARRQRAAERWAERQKAGPTSGKGNTPTKTQTQSPCVELRREGTKDELELCAAGVFFRPRTDIDGHSCSAA